MPRYIAKLVLREEGSDAVLATKSARLYSDELQTSEYALYIKAIELIRDMQWLASKGKLDPATFYKRGNIGGSNFWGLKDST